MYCTNYVVVSINSIVHVVHDVECMMYEDVAQQYWL